MAGGASPVDMGRIENEHKGIKSFLPTDALAMKKQGPSMFIRVMLWWRESTCRVVLRWRGLSTNLL